MILYINACVRHDSRTKHLTDFLLSHIGSEDADIKEVTLSELTFPIADEDFINRRYSLIDKGDYSASFFDYSKDFAAADTIVIAAPFWDLSFPAMLKQYLEQICVLGMTFYYENDEPKSLCKAKKLYYVTTAGGHIYSSDYGFGYVKSLAQIFFGIEECILIKAENLDIVGADVEKILRDAKTEINDIVSRGCR